MSLILARTRCTASSSPLEVLLHVVQVGGHDEVLRVGQVVLVGILLPACVVALVGDVALTTSRLKLSKVQPGLVVLETRGSRASVQAEHYLCSSLENILTYAGINHLKFQLTS